MAVHETIHVHQSTARDVTIPRLVFAAVKILLPAHEAVRIFSVLLANSRMLRKKLLQSGMVLHVLLVVHQGRIPAQLFRDLRMAIHEAVHVRQFASRYVAVTGLIFATIETLLLMHESVRILP